MEKMPGGILALPVSMGWNDVGDWAVLRGLLKQDAHGNAVSGNAVLVKSSGNMIKTRDRLIATVGLKDHAVVDLGDYLVKLGVNFEQNEVLRIDSDVQEAFLKNGALITTSCGCSGLSEELSQKAHGLCVELAERLRREF